MLNNAPEVPNTLLATPVYDVPLAGVAVIVAAWVASTSIPLPVVPLVKFTTALVWAGVIVPIVAAVAGGVQMVISNAPIVGVVALRVLH